MYWQSYGFGPPPAGVEQVLAPAAHSRSIRLECKCVWSVKTLTWYITGIVDLSLGREVAYLDCVVAGKQFCVHLSSCANVCLVDESHFIALERRGSGDQSHQSRPRQSLHRNVGENSRVEGR